MQIGEVDFPFIYHGTICLPARTKKLVKIHLINTKLKEAYIRRIQCGPGIFAGESLVYNVEGTAKILFINSNNQQINLTLPPVELEEYSNVFPEYLNPSNVDTKQASRFAEILKLINFSDLNDEEK